MTPTDESDQPRDRTSSGRETGQDLDETAAAARADEANAAARRAEQTEGGPSEADPDRTGRARSVPTPPAGIRTDGRTEPARPNWPGPSAASSVGQAGNPTAAGSSPAGSGVDQTSRPIPTTASPEAGSEEEIYRPGERRDPSVREDYARADADRRASLEPVGGVPPSDTTAPAPVTSIAGGRRRSEAVPDAVHGRTDVTSDTEWRDLQAKFVDDPEATVTEAAALIERDLAGLRAKLAGGDTESLRNAFKRYRSLHESLR